MFSLQHLLMLWHEYRVQLLVLVGILLVFVKYRSTRWTRRRTSREATKLGIEQSDSALQVRRGSKDNVLPTTSPPEARKVRPSGPKRITGSQPKIAVDASRSSLVQPVIFYFTLGGSTAKTATALALHLGQATETNPALKKPELLNLVDIDFDDYFVSPNRTTDQQLYLFLLPSYNIDTELNTFIDSLVETHNDFRIDTAPLHSIAGYSVFGIGDRQEWPTEQEGFCEQAFLVDKWLARLTGKKRAYPIGVSDARESSEAIRSWADGIIEVAEAIATGRGLGDGVNGSGEAVESDEEDAEVVESVEVDKLKSDAGRKKRKRRVLVTADLEDLKGPSVNEIDFTTTSIATKTVSTTTPKQMVPVSSPTYNSLTKQGYTIVGSHSGVKICRWTKSALRGRGSCYKYSFYGIASHRCMESTPSLSCSNKCVFCWRHGTNPVSTTWRWTVDPPELVFAGIKAGHYQKIKMMRGVPGVRAERFEEAMRIRHCALSLVGEPIFYPHINALLGMLHKEKISTFLVCNAQHPDQLEALDHVTQLYVSIDAATKEGLKKIDRPLHRDYWERFLRCMDILRAKRDMQRTVFRLTLVKGFNIDEEIEGYANLVERARPGFVEVKGVTYCGTSTSVAAGLTMRNVPFYEEVCAFVEALNDVLARRGLGYGIAAEHAHSCCILMAEKERFHKDDGWHTLIDYEGFFDCLASGIPFGPTDYVGDKTPTWALYGNGGFDPRDERVDRKGRPSPKAVSSITRAD